MLSTQIQGQQVFYFASRFFTLADKEYEITRSRITGPGPHDVTHFVRNLATGTGKDMTMIALMRHFASQK